MILNLQATPRGERTFQGVGGSLIVGMILPLISIWNHPVHKKLTIPHCMATPYTFCYGPTLCGLCFSLNLNKFTFYRCVSHWIFAMRHQSLSFIRSWSQAPRVLAGLKSQERGAEGWEEIAVGITCQGIPFIACQKNLLNTWPVLSFHCPDPWHKED